MGAFAISVIVAGAVTILGVVVIVWRASRARPEPAVEAILDVMRHVSRQPTPSNFPPTKQSSGAAREVFEPEVKPEQEEVPATGVSNDCGEQLPIAADPRLAGAPAVKPDLTTDTKAVAAQDTAPDTSSQSEIREANSPAPIDEIAPTDEHDSVPALTVSLGNVNTDEPYDSEDVGTVSTENGNSLDAESGACVALERDMSQTSATADSEITSPPNTAEIGNTFLRPKQRAVHRDRRGRRRNVKPASPGAPTETARAGVNQPPADARLRLALHPIQQTAVLTLVLSRPAGFPERASVEFGGKLVEFGAYDESRYDDIDVDWWPDLLSDELRIETADGFRWVRSARRIHIFSGDPTEPDLVSVSAARLGAEHALLFKAEDTAPIEEAARAAGSPELKPHDRWQGIPDGWRVLSGYVPVSAGRISDPAFRPLDPGFDFNIEFAGGLAIRPGVFARGHPPRIEIPALPDGATVSIGGERAWLNGERGWEAPGWDSPGQHIVDVVPGPSLTYEIAADPADGAGWAVFEIDDNRFLGSEPWARARICGATVSGPSGEQVFAHEMRPTLIALGAYDHATVLQQRVGVGVSVGLLPSAPEFLIASTGQRRHQGAVVWLGLEGASAPARGARRSTLAWAGVVRGMASRRLPVEGSDSGLARRTWQSTVRRARNLKRWRA